MGMTVNEKVYGSYSDADLNDWERFPMNEKVLTSSAFGAWLLRRDERRDKAIPKDQYEVRLKADMVAMLEELKKEIEEQCKIPNNNASAYDWNNGVYACYKVVQQKIDKLKENTDGNKND